jgi:AcrR family transcriptional regulator
MAKGTVYLYFRSKSDIYKAVFDHDMKVVKQSTMDRIEAPGMLQEKIEAFVMARLENAEAQRDFFRIMDADQGHFSVSGGQYRNWLREPVLHLAQAIEIAIQRCEFCPVSSEKAAWAIGDMTRGVIQRRLLGQNALSVRDEAAFVLRFALAALTHLPQ